MDSLRRGPGTFRHEGFQRIGVDGLGQVTVEARVRVFGGVRQKIGKHLGETQRVRIEGNRLRGQGYRKPMALTIEQRACRFDGRIDDAVKGELLGFELEFALRNPSDIQQVIQQVID
jgi:hypothetical protein